MAKDKKKRIPKEIGGFKLPKELRRKGEKLIDKAQAHLDSPQGKAMIAGGLSMAAAALAAAAEKSRAKAAAQEPANDAEQAAKPGSSGIDPQKVTAAVDQLLSGIFGKRA